MTNIKVFVIGKSYTTRFACDADSFYSCTVVSRTAKTVTIKDGDRVRRCKIYVYEGRESILPFGNYYSMAPVIKA